MGRVVLIVLLVIFKNSFWLVLLWGLIIFSAILSKTIRRILN